MDGTDLNNGIQSGIPAGMAAVVKGMVEFNKDLPDGIYNGTVRVSIKGVNLNPDFGRYLTVTDSVMVGNTLLEMERHIQKNTRNTILIYL